MLKRRLILVNSCVIVLSVLILLLVSASEIRHLFYRENSLLYDAQLEQSVNQLNSIFNDMKDVSLNTCIHTNLQRLLRNNAEVSEWSLEASNELDTLVANQSGSAFSIELLPVNSSGDVLEHQEDGVYRASGKMVSDYEIDYQFDWQFRPNDREEIRLVKKMYDSNDVDRVLGIVCVKAGVSSIAEAFWSFSAQSDIESKLYLMDQAGNVLFPYSLTSELPRIPSVSKVQSISYNLRNQQITVMHSFVQNHWKLVGVLNRASLLTGSMNVIRTVVLIGVLMILIGTIITYLMVSFLTKPLFRLMDWIRHSSDTKSYAPAPESRFSSREITLLYGAFNHLMDVIHQSFYDIEEANKQALENEFLLLQAQINPHFLYNTLDSIGWLAMKNGLFEVRDMSIYLADMYRNSLNNGNPLIRVENEIEQVRCYMNIMKMRYPNAYDDEYDVEDGTENYLIIKQILQPLVENAIFHGLYGWHEKGYVKVAVYKDDAFLNLSVRNNGRPADIDRMRQILKEDISLRTKHYGIHNVDERLRHLYGADNGLHFFYENNETNVLIRIPLDTLKEGLVE